MSRLIEESLETLRERLHVSQGVFAAYLNASVSTVQKWESGEKKPPLALVKLFKLLDRHPDLLDEIKAAC